MLQFQQLFLDIDLNAVVDIVADSVVVDFVDIDIDVDVDIVDIIDIDIDIVDIIDIDIDVDIV